MADSPTTRNRFRKQEVGAKTNAWGTDLNEDGGSDRLDEAMDGVVAFTLSGPKTLTSANYEADEARMRVLHVTGGTGGTITIPAVEKWYLVFNEASADAVLDNGTNDVAVSSGEANIVCTDGTAIFALNIKSYVDAAVLNASLEASLPAQSGNAGKFITTDGSNASWASIDVDSVSGLSGELDAKQGLDADLTAIAGLAPADGSILQRQSGAWASRTLSGLKSDLSLSNVDNTSDANKPVSTAQQTALDLKLNASAAPSGTIVGTSDSQTLTNKAISADNNTLGGIAASSFVLSDASGNLDGGASQKAIPTGTVVGTSDTQTLTNKRVTKRVVTAGSTSGTITPDADAADTYKMTGLTGSVTVAAPSGTPTASQQLILYLKDNGTSRSLSWNAIYRAEQNVTLPSATTISKHVRVACIYNSDDTKWDVVAVVAQV